MLGPQAPQSSSNPYAPPATASVADWAPNTIPEPPVPSGAPKVFGVLSIIFASIVLFFSLLQSCGGLVSPLIGRLGEMAPSADKKADEFRQVMATMSRIYTCFGIQGLVMLLMSALLLAIGIGQLRYRDWAGRWSVYWGGAALVVLAGMLALAFLYIGPAYQRMLETAFRASPTGVLPSNVGALGSFFGGTFSAVMIFFYAPYPILMLIFFSRERVRASMTR